MNKYLITYELKNPGRDYSGLYNTIKSLGLWWHYLASTWIIKSSTTLSAREISDRLVPHIDSNDYLLVIKIDTTDSQGWLPQDAWDWLNA